MKKNTSNNNNKLLSQINNAANRFKEFNAKNSKTTTYFYYKNQHKLKTNIYVTIIEKRKDENLKILQFYIEIKTCGENMVTIGMLTAHTTATSSQVSSMTGYRPADHQDPFAYSSVVHQHTLSAEAVGLAQSVLAQKLHAAGYVVPDHCRQSVPTQIPSGMV